MFILLLLGAGLGCASPRIDQFKAFSEAGIAYSKANEAVLKEAGDTAVLVDSAILQRARQDLTEPKDRREAAISHDRSLQQRLTLIRDIVRHSQLLKDYFEVLGEAVDSKAGDEVGTALGNTYKSLSGISPSLLNAQFGKSKVSDLLPAISNIAVVTFRSHLLERELKARAPLIERELALQEAMLKVIGEQLKVDLGIQLQMSESQEIVLPFTNKGDLPSSWATRRLQILSSQMNLETIEGAEKAAGKFRRMFVRLVKNELGKDSISLVLKDLNSILAIVEKMN